MTLLTIVQDAAVLAGLSKPGFVVASTDPGVVLLYSLVNQTGRELMRRHPWQALTDEKTFPTVAASAQVDAIPADFDRFINETIFNRTQNRPLWGPVSSREWQNRQASTVSGGISGWFRLRGGSFLITPTPSAGDSIAYEYVSKNWVTGDKPAMSADADTALLDENLIMLGAVWRYLAAKGLEYAEAFRTAEEQTLTAMATDGGKGTISMAGSSALQRVPTAPVLYDGQLITHA